MWACLVIFTLLSKSCGGVLVEQDDFLKTPFFQTSNFFFRQLIETFFFYSAYQVNKA